jgi:UDP-glucose 4-epimerase
VRIVVTGGAGFIGANLVRMLTADDRFGRVAVIDDLSTGFRENLDGLDIDLHVGSILDADLLDVAVTGADAIVHLAAVPSVPRSIADPMASHHANATGTLMVLEAARRHGDPHVIVASSSSVYGANQALPKHEELRTQPLSPYAVSKLAAESYALAYGHCYDLPTLVFRFFNVFGPLQAAGHAYAAAIPTWIDAGLNGRSIPINGDGKQTRDFTYVGSVAAVIVQALLRQAVSADPVNLAFGTRRTLLDTVASIGAALDMDLACEHGPDRAGDVPHSQADGSRLAAMVPGFHPVDFEVGLAETVAWFRTLPEYTAASATSSLA